MSETASRTGDKSSAWGRLRHVSSAEMHNGGPLTGPGEAERPRRAATEPAAREPRPLRADAERNRRRILRAAAEVFTERGLQATLDDVARRAGVGVGTVYRRFPDKESLVGQLFLNQIEALAGAAEKACEAADPWAGFLSYLEYV